jgi:YidC/Oxa1 family membrane protein insertase
VAIDQLRNLLLIGLCVIGFLLWQAWQQDYGPKRTPPVQDTAGTVGEIPSPPVEEDVPSLPTAPTEGTAAAPPPQPAIAAGHKPIRVTTDVMRIEISPVGGAVQRVELLDYPVTVEAPDIAFKLLDYELPDVFIAQSGLRGEGAVPDHHGKFVATAAEFTLADDSDTLEVRLQWQDSGDVRIAKVYTFERDSYVFSVSYEIENTGEESWSARMYGQFLRSLVVREGGLFRTYTYTGGVISGPEKPYEKIDFDDMSETDLKRLTDGGWVAMIQHYFAGAWVPSQEAKNYYYSKAVSDERFVIGVMTPEHTVAPGDSARIKLRLYAGPKIQKRLKVVAPNLERTVDYGWLWVIAEPLFWLLHYIHGFLGNWGWSIIVLTLLIKLAFFHLSATSYKSMARMRKMQPRIVALRDRYAGDKQRMNQAMMELYKKEKINPLGGCLPILVQIPVFIALYWVLLESVELRQASFIWWLQDLSVHDPFFILPVAMGATMFFQQKLNPAPPDPTQAKIMMALPFVFTFLFLFFPSGLVLYWFVNNLLSIAQQWVITRKIVGPTQT